MGEFARSEGIDLIELRYQSGTNEWNRFLAVCLAKHDMTALGDVYRRTNIGMTDLAKHKLNTDDIVRWYLRLQKSIENTALLILKQKHPGDPIKQTRAKLEAIVARWRF